MKRKNDFKAAIMIACMLFAGLSASCVTGENKAAPNFSQIDWSKSLSNIIFDIEESFFGKALYLDSDKGEIGKEDLIKYSALLKSQARRKIHPPADYSKEEIVKVSLAFDAFLKAKGINYAEVEKYAMLEFNLFSVGLVRKKMNCIGHMLAYLMLTEDSEFKLDGIYVSGHYFVIWNKKINWDSTWALALDDKVYLDWKKVAPGARGNGFYLRPLTKKEIVGIAYLNIAQTLREQKRYKQMDLAIYMALKYFPSPDALNEKGLGLKARGRFKEALEYFNRTIVLDENNSEAISNRIVVLAEFGRWKEVNKDIKKLRLIDMELAGRLEKYFKRRFKSFNI